MCRSTPLLLLSFLSWHDTCEGFAGVPPPTRGSSLLKSRYSASFLERALAPTAPDVAIAVFGKPCLSTLALTCLVPSLLGFYKSEYGVSYAYGAAISSTAWMVLSTRNPLQPWNNIAGMHAMALLAYGIRLNAFLLYRELAIARFREIRERIEARAKQRGNRLARTPFVVSVALLYACMTAPLFVTNSLSSVPFWNLSQDWKHNLARFLVGTTWAGFVLGAIGDTTKTAVKRLKGADHLVTEGVYRFLRHPNYTGEFLAWTSSALASFVIGGVCWLNLASLVGAMGINFVLVQAATGLERKQLEKYGNTESYKTWVRETWAGFTMKQAS